MESIDQFLATLVPCTQNVFANAETLEFSIDPANNQFVYRWRERGNGGDPYYDYEEYCRVELSLQSVRNLVEKGMKAQALSSVVVSGTLAKSHVRIDYLSGQNGGTGKVAWTRPNSQSRDARVVRVKLAFIPKAEGLPTLSVDIY
jgi:hypothetical protein